MEEKPWSGMTRHIIQGVKSLSTCTTEKSAVLQSSTAEKYFLVWLMNVNSILVIRKAGIGKFLFCQTVIRDWANIELLQVRENSEIPNLKFGYLLSLRQLNFLENNWVTLREISNFSSVLGDKCNVDYSTFDSFSLVQPMRLFEPF